MFEKRLQKNKMDMLLPQLPLAMNIHFLYTDLAMYHHHKRKIQIVEKVILHLR
jgi:hypothetical protein